MPLNTIVINTQALDVVQLDADVRSGLDNIVLYYVMITIHIKSLPTVRLVFVLSLDLDASIPVYVSMNLSAECYTSFCTCAYFVLITELFIIRFP